jgi:hypothetical protein
MIIIKINKTKEKKILKFVIDNSYKDNFKQNKLNKNMFDRNRIIRCR